MFNGPKPGGVSYPFVPQGGGNGSGKKIERKKARKAWLAVKLYGEKKEGSSQKGFIPGV